MKLAEKLRLPHHRQYLVASAKKVKSNSPLIVFFTFILGLGLVPPAGAEMLRPKRGSQKLISPQPDGAQRSLRPRLTAPNPRQDLRPKREARPPVITPQAATSSPPKTDSPTTLSLIGITPLFSTNTYEQRFSTFGGELLCAFPVFELGNPFQLELGLSATLSSLSLSQPSLTFSHWYFLFPLRLRTGWQLGDSRWRFDIWAGTQLRTFEYDTRDTTDGGFHSTGNFLDSIEFDAGIGINIPIRESYFIRLNGSYRRLGLGLEFTI